MKTGYRNLQDVYTYLEKVSSLQDTEFPIILPVNIRFELGEKKIVDLKINIQWPEAFDDYKWFTETDRTWTPRPIFLQTEQ